jgi:hypothetical protein
MRFASIPGALALLAGCATAAIQVQKRAALDFGCPEERVTVDSAAPGYVARGCEKEADYVVADGRVSRNSAIRKAPPSSTPLPIDRIPGTNSIGIH